MLTKDRVLQLDGIVSQMEQNNEDAATIQKVVDDFKGLYDVQQTEPSSSKTSLAQKAADMVNKGYERYAGTSGSWTDYLSPMKYVAPVVGGAVGLAGGAIGGVVGAIGGTAKEIYDVAKGGEFSGKDIWEATKTTAVDTAKAGYGMGRAGTAAAPLGAIGYAPNIVIAYGQGYQSVQDLIEAREEGDIAKQFEAGLGLGTAVMAAITPGIKVKEVVKAKSAQPLKSGILVSPELATAVKNLPKEIKKVRIEKARNEAYKTYETVYNQSKSLLQKDPKGEITKFIADQGYVPEVKNNKIDNTKSIELNNERQSALEDAYQLELSKRPNQDISLSAAENSALESWNQTKNVSAKVKQEGRLKIKEFIDAERRELALEKLGNPKLVKRLTKKQLKKFDTVNGTKANEIKRGAWNSAYNENNKIVDDTSYAIGDAFRNELEARYPELKAMNKELGLYSKARYFLTKTNGNTIKGGGWLSRQIARITGGGIGAMIAGPEGAIMGGYLGEKILQSRTNPNVQAIKAQKVLQQK